MIQFIKELLNFVFKDIWHFLGTLLLLDGAGSLIIKIIKEIKR